MPRGRQAKKRVILPDPLYGSILVAKLINQVMRRGKKTLATKIVYGALGSLNAEKTEAENLLRQALEKIMPQEEVRPRRVGGATYQVPLPVRPERAESLALRWLIRAARVRRGRGMAENLAAEIREALAGTGAAVKKREEVQRMAEANKAFAHFRW
jgi:small subunit ribosomal protein S7